MLLRHKDRGKPGSRPVSGALVKRGRSRAAARLAGPAALVLISACSGPPGGEKRVPAETGRRLVLIGLDAADGRFIEEGIAAGRLPGFARICREGTWGPLRTHRPILSPLLWTSIATGLTPDRHGVLDFLERDTAGRTIPVSARSRRARTFWEILGDRGISCGIVGWLATWPASRMNGFLVSDRVGIHPFAPQAPREASRTAGKTWPPELLGAVEPLLEPPEAVADSDLERVFGVAPVPAGQEVRERRELRVIESVAKSQTAIALGLAEARRPALLAVYYEAIDRLMHLFGPVLPPPLPGVDPARAARYGASVGMFYAAMDARLMRYLEFAGQDATVIVVSDHGFKTGSERPRHPALRGDVFAAEWHRDPGVILAWGRGVRRGGRLEGADLYDVAPTVLALFGAPASREMRGRVLEEMFEPGFLPPIGPRVASYPPPEPIEEVPGDGNESREMLENLQALGYVAGGEDPARRAQANLATFYMEEKQFDRAIALYRKVLEADPADLTALYNIGYAYRGLGDNARAAECFERLLAARPDYSEARLVLSDCYSALGRTADALSLLRADEGRGREDPGLQNHLGTVLAAAGRLEEAEAAFERSIALRAEEASPYLNLARVRLARGNRAGALRTLEQAARAAPGDPRVAARLRDLRTAR